MRIKNLVFAHVVCLGLWRGTQHSRMNLSRVHRISRRLPDTSAICSVQITIFTSRRAAHIYERVDMQNFIFFPPTRILVRATNSLCARCTRTLQATVIKWDGRRAVLAMLLYASLVVFPAIRSGCIVDNRLVRTYRVINDGRWYSSEWVAIPHGAQLTWNIVCQLTHLTWPSDYDEVECSMK